MSHPITVEGLVIFFGVVISLIALGVGILWAIAKGMSDTP